MRRKEVCDMTSTKQTPMGCPGRGASRACALRRLDTVGIGIRSRDFGEESVV
jgi:hypothetical protein